MSNSNVSYDNLPTKPMPEGLQKTPLQRTNEAYQKLLKEGKINPDGTPKEGANIPELNNNKKIVETKEEPKKDQDIIKEYLATKTEYKVLINDTVVTKPRHDLNPGEHFELLDLIEFHGRMIGEIQNLERRRIILNAKLNILSKTLGTLENINQYDELIQQIDALNTRYQKMTWIYKGNTFNSSTEFAIFLYQKTLEYCLKMPKEEFDKSAFRSNKKLASESDIWGTRQIADACIDVELHSYAYFQMPSKSSSES